MQKYLLIISFIGICSSFSQNNFRQPISSSVIEYTNFIELENSIRPFLNDSSNFGQHQSFSLGFNVSRGIPANIYTYNNTIYYKINNSLIADANFTLSNFTGSQYEDKYGYKLLNDISGDFDAGVRYYPIKNSFFNIDARNYHSLNGTGSSLDLDFMGITIKRFVKKGYINDNF
mgnify:CR=1 FL=1|tara:strand:- start:1751 stop:2272 length:522 start_codon:yes stop_codon:yes gene_type:complete